MTTTQAPAADLATMTPVEVDTILARLYGERATLGLTLSRAADAVHSYTDSPSHSTRWGREYLRSLDDALAAADSGEGVRAYYAANARDYAAKVRSLREQIAANKAEQAPLHAEYERRRWTRAFLVLTSGTGHVHSSMDCSTCNKMGKATQFAWLPNYSGKDQAEIIEAAGSDACTVCFPDAPVTAQARDRSMWAPSEIEAEKAREERAAAKAARDAAKAAKAITDVDGSPLRVVGVPSTFGWLDTLAAAKKFLTDGAEWNWNHDYYPAAGRDQVAAAVAAKVGTTPEAEIAAATKRAAKRR